MSKPTRKRTILAEFLRERYRDAYELSLEAERKSNLALVMQTRMVVYREIWIACSGKDDLHKSAYLKEDV